MPGSRLYSWRGGVESLPAALAASLGVGSGGAVRTNAAVRRLRREGAGFRIDLGRAGVLRAKSVVLATQPHVTAQLLADEDPAGAAAAAAISAPPLAVVFLGYARRAVAHPLDGLGFLAAAREWRCVNGVQFCSTMFPGRAPDGHVALAAYFGGARRPDLGMRPAGELIALARAELRDLLGASGAPVVARVRHWPRGLPQYGLDHGDIVASLAAGAERSPGLFVTGNFLDGPAIASCVAAAEDCAARVGRYLAAGVADGATRRNRTVY